MSQQLKSLQFTFSLKFILVLCTIMYNIRYVHDHIHSVGLLKHADIPSKDLHP